MSSIKRRSRKDLEAKRKARKAEFVRLLAEFLSGKDQAAWSIKLEMKDPVAQIWAKLRAATPLFGWLSIEEAEKVLTEFLA